MGVSIHRLIDSTESTELTHCPRDMIINSPTQDLSPHPQEEVKVEENKEGCSHSNGRGHRLGLGRGCLQVWYGRFCRRGRVQSNCDDDDGDEDNGGDERWYALSASDLNSLVLYLFGPSSPVILDRRHRTMTTGVEQRRLTVMSMTATTK